MPTCPRTTSRLLALALPLLSLSCTVQPAAGPRGDGYRVLAVGPTGEVGDEIQGGLRVTFDRPMIPLDRVGQPVDPSPLALDPPLPGRARFTDPTTLALLLDEPPRPSVRYRVRLDPSLHALDGAVAAAPVDESFVYRRLRADRMEVEARSPQFAPRDVRVTVGFSLPVRVADVVASCAFVDGLGAALPAVADGEEAGGTVTRLSLRPAAPLPADAALSFRCKAGLRPEGGGEGLAEDKAVALRTFGAFRVVSLEPVGGEVGADGATVRVEFSTPVDGAAVREHVRLKPAVRGFQLAADDMDARIYRAHVDLEPDTDYTLTVDEAIADRFGQRLGKDALRTMSFHVGDASPRLKLERGIYAVEGKSGRYPVWSRNLSRFDVTCARVADAKLVEVLTRDFQYDAWSGDSGRVPDFSRFGGKPHRFEVKIAKAKNRWHDDAIDLAGRCGGGDRASGVYVLHVESAEAPLDKYRPERVALASVTDLGLLAKIGDSSSLVWVVRMSDGQPVPGAKVQIRDLTGKVRFTGETGADGTAAAPGAAALIAHKPPRASSVEEGEDGELAWEERGMRRVIITASVEGDTAVLDTNWNNGIQSWNFALGYGREAGPARVRGFLQSDRGLYRPGDTVHLRGLARVLEEGGRMRPPSDKTVHLDVLDPQEAKIVSADLPLTRFGGFFRDVTVAPEARLGDYTVAAKLGDQVFRDHFSVEEYRTRTFEVKLDTGAGERRAGERIRVSAEARFLYGAPVGSGTLKWEVQRRPFHPRFPGYEQYGFEDFASLDDEWRWTRRWDEDRSYTSFVGDGEEELDRRGRASFVIKDDEARGKGAPKGPFTYLIETTVTDASGQGVPATAAINVHPTSVYLGLHPQEWVQAVDMPFAVQVVALAPDGKRRPAKAELAVTRRTWDCRGSIGCRATDHAVLQRSIDVPEAGSAVERIVLKEAGEHFIRVATTDERGKRSATSDSVYVIGPGEALWSGDEGDRIGLSVSKPKYKPGEVARLVPRVQLPGAIALVTVERDGIMKKWVMPAGAGAGGIEVPVEDAWAPNVFVSVAMVRGRRGEGDADRPRFKMGMARLDVDASRKQLAVEVKTDRPTYRPGEAVAAAVRVTDAAGKPVVAELAVAVADEGVLQIAGYKTPDPMPKFYAAYDIDVDSSTTWNRIARHHAPDEGDPEEGGDGGGDEAGRIRSRFMATAFWAPAVVTKDDGTAVVTFTVPDNLTAFRVMAVAADAGDRFGSSEQRFTVAKPLLAMPALPRFLTVGDHARAGVVVHNRTGAPGALRVRAEISGARLDGAAELAAEVKDGEERPMLFSIAAERAGEVTARFFAELGSEKDAVEVKLPVERPLLREAHEVAEGRTEGRIEAKVTVPEGVLDGEGGLEVTLDATGLARLDEGLRYLVGYPYGCLEQTTSRVVPMVAIGDLAKGAALPGVDRDKLRGFVEAGIAKIYRHQTGDGGFGLWPGSEAEVDLTAYALYGLRVAKDAGYAVDAGVVRRGVEALERAAGDYRGHSYGHTAAGEEGARAFAAWVLSLWEKKGGRAARTDGAVQHAFERRKELPRYGQAMLARALHRVGREADARAIVEELVAALPAGAAPAMVTEPELASLRWHMASEARTTALVLGALLEIDPKHPAVTRLEEGLLARRVDGRWEDTQGNFWSLTTLAELARSRRGQALKASVLLDGKPILAGTLKGTEVRRVSIPLARVRKAQALVVEGGAPGRPLFVSARLRTARPAETEAKASGFTIEREWLDPSTDEPIEQVKLGQIVKVSLSVVAERDATRVAVVDHLPAGLEPVLERFRKKDEDTAPAWSHGDESRWVYRQMHDDRVEVFADELPAGRTFVHSYLARATTPGRFAAAPATVEAMYEPARQGHTGAAKLHVVGR